MTVRRASTWLLAVLCGATLGGCALTAMPRPDGSDARDPAPWDGSVAANSGARVSKEEAAHSAQDGATYSATTSGNNGRSVETFVYCDHTSPSCPHNIVRMHTWSFGMDTGICEVARVGRPLWLSGGDSITVRVDPMGGGQPESVLACRVDALPIDANSRPIASQCVRLTYHGYADGTRCICPTEQVWTGASAVLWSGRDRTAAGVGLDTLTVYTRAFETCGRAPGRVDTVSVRASEELLRGMHTD